MKKIFLILLCILPMMFTSCVKEEEDLFEDSAAVRLQKELLRYQQLLTNAPNGWIMEYFSDLGGYIFLCSFNARGEVTVALEGEEGTTASNYRLITSDGPVLTFDTYNELFHIFSDPGYSPPDGYMGDYEFIFMEGSAEKIVLSGKKHHNMIVMTPFPANKNWDDYLNELLRIEESCDYGYFDIHLGTDSIANAVLSSTERSIQFEFEGITQQQRFIYTLSGICLYDTITIGQYNLLNFTWDETNLALKCVDQGATDITFRARVPDDYLPPATYEGAWDFSYQISADAGTRTTRPVTLLKDGKTFYLRGLWPSKPDRTIVLKYESGSGRLTLSPQNIDVYGENIINFAPWMVVGEGNLWPGVYSSPGQHGVWDKVDREKPVITWVDYGNGSFYPERIRGWILWMLTSSGGNAGRYSAEPTADCRFVDIIMTKK
ncbi:MAG: DUF4302 domain-containing protein [Tannerella sp.]|nr:DUF4302 domain-containing protein [Tannerella sp.]